MKKRAEPMMDTSSLPEIDMDKARELLATDYLSVPDGWPRNWQWIVAINDAVATIEECERRIVNLRSALPVFRSFLESGSLWPGITEVTVPCIKGGYEKVLHHRRKRGRDDST